MCLILFALQQHKDYPLIVIANRDEFYARPTRPAHWWDDHAQIFAGRDLTAQGTWMGVTRQGRFAAVTNVREPGGMSPGERSRGDLTREFLQNAIAARDYLEQLQPEQHRYSGFNLLVGDENELWFSSNRQPGIRKIEPGVYGVSNGAFDEPWPKLKTGKQALAHTLQTTTDSEQLMQILGDKDQVADHLLPETGVETSMERLLSSRFIHSAEYGTRASTLIRYSDRNSIEFIEKNYDADGSQGEPVFEHFSIIPG